MTVVDAIPVGSEEPEAPGRHPATTQLLRWFGYEHLPTELGVVSMQFHHLAHELVDRLPDSPELTVALRKLLEGKDAAVRAAIETGAPAVPRIEARSTQQVSDHLEREMVDRSAAEQSAPAGPQFVAPVSGAGDQAYRLGRPAVLDS